MSGLRLGTWGFFVYPKEDRENQHGTPIDQMHRVGRQKILQTHSMVDYRTGTKGIPVTGSGFAIIRSVTPDPDRGPAACCSPSPRTAGAVSRTASSRAPAPGMPRPAFPCHASRPARAGVPPTIAG